MAFEFFRKWLGIDKSTYKFGIKCALVIAGMIAVVLSVLRVLHTHDQDMKKLKEKIPAFGIVVDSLQKATNHLEEAQEYSQNGNLTDALEELDNFDRILDKKIVSNSILNSLVENNLIGDDERDAIISLRARSARLREDIMRQFANERKGFV